MILGIIVLVIGVIVSCIGFWKFVEPLRTL
jgi:hypothetical protein